MEHIVRFGKRVFQNAIDALFQAFLSLIFEAALSKKKDRVISHSHYIFKKNCRSQVNYTVSTRKFYAFEFLSKTQVHVQCNLFNQII